MKKTRLHTKGYWDIKTGQKKDVIYSENFGAICEIPHHGKAISEHHANAALIAAAPDLFVALSVLLEAGIFDDRVHTAVVDAKMALNKAQGLL